MRGTGSPCNTVVRLLHSVPTDAIHVPTHVVNGSNVNTASELQQLCDAILTSIPRSDHQRRAPVLEVVSEAHVLAATQARHVSTGSALRHHTVCTQTGTLPHAVVPPLAHAHVNATQHTAHALYLASSNQVGARTHQRRDADRVATRSQQQGCVPVLVTTAQCWAPHTCE